ncbi:MAG: type II secretion system protein GspG [Lentisphaeria bacterium]
MKQRHHAFTLVELLVVIGIVMVLAGITLAGLGFAGRRADESKTMAIMEEFAMALEAFRQDYGYYPIQTNPDSRGDNLRVNFRESNDTWDLFLNRAAESNKKNRSYMEGIVGGANNEELLDAYGNALYYRSPGRMNPQKYDLWSMGPDGRHGAKSSSNPNNHLEVGSNYMPGAANSDDLCNWKQKR